MESGTIKTSLKKKCISNIRFSFNSYTVNASIKSKYIQCVLHFTFFDLFKCRFSLICLAVLIHSTNCLPHVPWYYVNIQRRPQIRLPLLLFMCSIELNFRRVGRKEEMEVKWGLIQTQPHMGSCPTLSGDTCRYKWRFPNQVALPR